MRDGIDAVGDRSVVADGGENARQMDATGTQPTCAGSCDHVHVDGPTAGDETLAVVDPHQQVCPDVGLRQERPLAGAGALHLTGGTTAVEIDTTRTGTHSDAVHTRKNDRGEPFTELVRKPRARQMPGDARLPTQAFDE